VLREGLRLVETREAEEAAKLEALVSAAAAAGVAAFDRGEFRDFDEAPDLVDYLTALSDRRFRRADSRGPRPNQRSRCE
jgi:antitoxin ParD1/3/4